MGRPVENVVVWRQYRVHILRDSVSGGHYDTAGMAAVTDRCGLSGAGGNCVGADHAVLQGVWEQRLSECQVGGIPNKVKGIY